MPDCCTRFPWGWPSSLSRPGGRQVPHRGCRQGGSRHGFQRIPGFQTPTFRRIPDTHFSQGFQTPTFRMGLPPLSKSGEKWVSGSTLSKSGCLGSKSGCLGSSGVMGSTLSKSGCLGLSGVNAVEKWVSGSIWGQRCRKVGVWVNAVEKWVSGSIWVYGSMGLQG